MVSYSYFYRSMALWSHDLFLPCCLTMRRSNPARWNVLQLQLTDKWLQIWPRFETFTKMTLTLRHWHCNRRNLPNSMIRTFEFLMSNTIWWCNPNIFSLKPNGQLDFNDSAAVRWVFLQLKEYYWIRKGIDHSIDSWPSAYWRKISGLRWNYLMIDCVHQYVRGNSTHLQYPSADISFMQVPNR